jgi:RimJ/RimL family protein N-acetyltransferase
MKSDNKLSFLIDGEAFLFRDLEEEDVTPSYVDALRRQRAFLDNNPSGIDIQWQRNYVLNIRESKWDTICGLFVNSKLIGTSGIQNIKRGEQATLGIFVLSSEDRGKGYGRLLTWTSCYFINHLFSVDSFKAGVKKSNDASWRSFKSCGFQIVHERQDAYTLMLTIVELKTPEFLKDIKIV